jgi:hypothetical protein
MVDISINRPKLINWFLERKVYFFIPIFFVLLASWAMSSPIGAANDDEFHLASIWCAKGDSDNCTLQKMPEENPDTVVKEIWYRDAMVPSQFSGVWCWIHKSSSSAACNDPESKNFSLNRTNAYNYPGLYYSIMNLFILNDVENSVLFLRLISIFLICSIFFVTLVIVNKEMKLNLIFLWLLTLFPFTIFFYSSNNPFGLHLAIISVFWVVISSFLLEKDRVVKRLKFVFLLFLLLLGLGTRVDTGIFLSFSATIVSIFHFDTIKMMVKSQKVYLFSLISIIFVPILYFLFQEQFTYLDGSTVPDPTLRKRGVAILVKNLIDLPTYFYGILGGKGHQDWPLGLSWDDTPMLNLVPFLLMLILGVTLGYLLKVVPRINILMSAITILLGVAVPVMFLQQMGRGATGAISPRYLIPFLFLALAFLIYQNKTSFFKHFNDNFLIVFGLCIFGAGALSQRTLINRFVSGLTEDELRFGLIKFSVRNNIEWWWDFGPKPDGLWYFSTLILLILIVLTASLIREEFVTKK